MLQAKKEALENTARQKLVAIREMELDYYTSNCRNISQCAAVVCGLAYSGIRYHYLLERKTNYRQNFEDSLEECARAPRAGAARARPRRPACAVRVQRTRP